MKRIIIISIVVVLLIFTLTVGIGFTGSQAQTPVTPSAITTPYATTMPSVSASPSTPNEGFQISGTIEGVQVFMDPNPSMKDSKLTGHNAEYSLVHGDMEGVIELNDISIIDPATGKFTYEGVGIFTGTVKGIQGSFIYRSVGSGQFMNQTGDTGILTSDNTIVTGTGSLANLRGTSHSESKWSPSGETSTYSGLCWFGQ